MLIAPPVQTLPAPDPHMHDLAWFLGEWSIFSRTFQAEPAGTWAEETIFAVHSAELGGNMIWEHFFGIGDYFRGFYPGFFGILDR